jgi:hypothetical protein
VSRGYVSRGFAWDENENKQDERGMNSESSSRVSFSSIPSNERGGYEYEEDRVNEGDGDYLRNISDMDVLIKNHGAKQAAIHLLGLYDE